MDRFGGCWHDTLPGHFAKTRCPDIPSFNPNAFAYRKCTLNGTWFVNSTTGYRQANYTECMMSDSGWCQVLHNICQYFTVCNFLWMFCEGLYLNTTIVFVFNTGKKLIITCYLIGWGIPVLVVSIYAIVRTSLQESATDCWLGESSLQWIVYGPIVFSIGVNVLFLINIIRLLITKLRQLPEVDQTRKATKATLILVPLLGLQYLLFPIRPEAGTELEHVYHITIALLISLQVLQVLRRKWSQHKLMARSGMQASLHGTTYTCSPTEHQSQQHLDSNGVRNGKQVERKDVQLELEERGVI
ncbi:hypothetical protein ACF0H5_018109 [Mactra antiquata]